MINNMLIYLMSPKINEPFNFENLVTSRRNNINCNSTLKRLIDMKCGLQIAKRLRTTAETVTIIPRTDALCILILV